MQIYHKLDQELQIRAEGWAITIRRLDLKDLDSAMSRPRTFFIGLHPQMHRTTQQEELLGLPYSSHYNLKLADFLDKKACPSDFEGLTVRQQQNLLQYLDIYNQARGSDAHKDSTFGAVDVGRDPNLHFGSAITIGSLATLGTNNGTVWLLPASQMQAVYGPKGRLELG